MSLKETIDTKITSTVATAILVEMSQQGEDSQLSLFDFKALPKAVKDAYKSSNHDIETKGEIIPVDDYLMEVVTSRADTEKMAEILLAMLPEDCGCDGDIYEEDDSYYEDEYLY